MTKTMKDFKIFFGGKIYQIGKNLPDEIQKDLEAYPELELSVRGIQIEGFTVKVSINRDAPHVYYADEDSLVRNDALVFTGNFKDGPDEVFTIPMPEQYLPLLRHPFSNICHYLFYITDLVAEYNLVMKRNNKLKDCRSVAFLQK